MSIFSKDLQTAEINWRKRIKMGFFIVLSIVVILNFIIWFWVTQPVLVSVSNNQITRVEPEKLKFHVKTLSETFFPRNEANIENLNKTAAYIKNEFEKAKGVVLEQPYQVGNKTYKNVIAQFGPDTEERIVIGAHYDAAGLLPAADDNANGVAGIIELANLLGKERLPIKVELVAFTLEEPPYFATMDMGSVIHANSLKEKGVKVRLMISVEMIGYFSDAPNSQDFPVSLLGLVYPTTGNFITIIGNLENGLTVRQVKKAMQKGTALQVCSMNAPRNIPGIDYSDHLNYWNQGYNALMISDTAFYRNKNYHTSNDTFEKLDYKRMAMVVEGLYKVVLNVGK